MPIKLVAHDRLRAVLYERVVLSAVAALTLSLLVACASGSSVAPEGIFLPRLTGEPPRFGAAAIEGTVVEDRGCLELIDLYLSAEFASPSPDAVALILWPDGSTATRRDDGALSVDAPDLPSAVSGQRLFVGGGFTSSLADAEQMIGEPIPVACRVGRYWVATPIHS